MHEAVIVCAARSPIVRAGKGSMKEIRPEELATQMVRTALAGVPELVVTDGSLFGPSTGEGCDLGREGCSRTLRASCDIDDSAARTVVSPQTSRQLQSHAPQNDAGGGGW